MKLPFWYLTFQEQHSLFLSKNFWVFFSCWVWLFAEELWSKGNFLHTYWNLIKLLIVFHLPKSLLFLLIYGTRFSKVPSYLCSVLNFQSWHYISTSMDQHHVNSTHLNSLNSISPHNNHQSRTVLDHLGYDILLLIHFEEHSSHLFNKFMAIDNFVVLTILFNS